MAELGYDVVRPVNNIAILTQLFSLGAERLPQRSPFIFRQGTLLSTN